jgi:hypothetical protein
MRATLTLVALSLSLTTAACLHKELNPGRCNSTNDCLSGQTCDLSPAANGTCVCTSPSCMDGGASGSGGGGGGGSGGTGNSAGDGGQDVAPTCQPSCTAPRSTCTPDLTCVECLTNADCNMATKPICDATGTCVACTSDEQCAAKLPTGPGVCMAHQDGRCATDAETIYVQNDAPTCSDAVQAGDAGADVGTRSKPFCSMQPVPLRLTTSRALVVVRGTVGSGSWTFTGPSDASIVGQQSAFVSSGPMPAFSISSGSILIREVKFASSASIGIRATGGTVRLERVTVDSCMGGGILLDGAAFDIQNTTVTRNGPATDGATSWGGILVKALPSSGLSRLDLVTLQNNNNAGLVCAAQIEGTGVFASGNIGGIDVNPTCAVITCTPMSSTCGSQ